MSQRNMYSCTDCDSIVVVTVVEVTDEKQPQYCCVCSSDKILKIEAKND